MPVSAGSSIGPYVISSPLGSGGMGEVYRARDLRLNRDVAIKVLAPRLAADVAARNRIGREAQALAALSHPSIVAVYDVGQHEDSTFVVMEFLEGETLRARLAEGPLPLRRVLDYAVQIADALGAAHGRGIVHRDLKPENIFITTDGRPKILDLGLATLATAAGTPSANLAALSTTRSTGPGLIVGTIGYMAPEQARAQPVDARADIFSFGAVLYEMLTGRRAFDGEAPADVLASVLHSEPPEIPAGLHVPPPLERIVRRCIEKRPEDRFQSARDLAFALDGIATASTGSYAALQDVEPARRRAWWWGGAALASAIVLAAAALAAGRAFERVPVPRHSGAVRFTVEANRGAVPEVSVSPNGRYLAWTALANAGQAGGLWVRRLDAAEPALVPNSPPQGTPFWSPDEREIVMVTRENALVAFDVERGSRRVLHELAPESLPVRGGDWRGDTILVSSAGAIWRLDLTSKDGLKRVTSVRRPGEDWHGWPQFLPDDRRFVYTAAMADGSMETRLASIDGGESTRIALPGDVTRVRVDRRGYLLFGHGGALVAQRVNFATGAVEGNPVRVALQLLQNQRSAWAAVDVSRDGLLAWRAPGSDYVQFEWVDRAGRTVQSIAEPDAYTNFDLSPDDARIVTTQRRREAGTALFLIDTRRNATTLISDENALGAMSDPTWSPDGRLVAYRRGNAVVARSAFGGEERVLANWTGYPDSWRNDGKYLIVGRPQGSEYNLWAIALDGHEEVPLVRGLALADEGRFSPDGRWVVFHAALQGSPDVFAIPFPPTGERWQISTLGGVQPRWRADGRELYYLAPSGHVMAVSIPDGDPRRASAPQPLFNLRFDPSAAFDQFTPAHDGDRFLVRRPLRPGGADTAPVNVLVNWADTLNAAGTR